MAHTLKPDRLIEIPDQKRDLSLHPPARERASSKFHPRSWLRQSLPIIFSSIFLTGLFVQTFGTHLQITNHAFVIPPSLVAGGKDLHPAQIIAEERNKQMLAAVLTMGGALALAIYYRKVLMSSLMAQFTQD
jgi:hypothetical protein